MVASSSQGLFNDNSDNNDVNNVSRRPIAPEPSKGVEPGVPVRAQLRHHRVDNPKWTARTVDETGKVLKLHASTLSTNTQEVCACLRSFMMNTLHLYFCILLAHLH